MCIHKQLKFKTWRNSCTLAHQNVCYIRKYKSILNARHVCLIGMNPKGVHPNQAKLRYNYYLHYQTRPPGPLSLCFLPADQSHQTHYPAHSFLLHLQLPMPINLIQFTMKKLSGRTNQSTSISFEIWELDGSRR